MGLALAIATFLVVIFTLGFDIDPKTGEVIRKGLIVVDTHPEPANITINGQSKGQTKGRFTLPEGQYDIKLEREGYRPWTRSLILEGSSIAQLVYAFMFPVELKPTTIFSYEQQPEIATQSPDRRWYLVSQPGELGTFDMYDLNQETTQRTQITLPPDTLTLTGEKHTFKDAEWSTDNRHILINHVWSGGSEFIVVDRAEPLSSINVSKLYPDLPITSITLRDKRADEFYAYIASSKTIAQLSSETGDITVLLRNVTGFKPYKDTTILYAKQIADDAKNVEVRMLDDGEDYAIREIPAAKAYMLDLAEYDGTLYVVAGSPADGKLYVYEEPVQQINDSIRNQAVPLRVMAVKNAVSAVFSQNARFISLHGSKEVVIHDSEEVKQYRYVHDIQLAPNQKITWMDGHRLYAVDEGKTVVFDFDGSNRQELIETDRGYLPIFNRDYESMFQLKAAEDTVDLLRINILLTLNN